MQQLCAENADSVLGDHLKSRSDQRPGDAPAVVVLAGPPGSGKTTAAKKLAQRGVAVCLERPDENPYLMDSLAGKPYAGYPCQDWFTGEVESFLARADREESIVLDQDPAAFGLVYGHQMRQRGVLDAEESVKLTERLCAIEAQLAQWPACHTVLLHAPVEVLEQRLLQRGSDESETFWLEKLRNKFFSFGEAAGATMLDTTDLTPDEVVEQVQRLALLDC